MTTLVDGLAAYLKEERVTRADQVNDVSKAFYAGAAVMAEQFARADLLAALHDMSQLTQMRSSYVHVWSFQHVGWWKPNEHGYSTEIQEAGKYLLGRAWDICSRANVRHVQDAIVPVNPLWLEYGLPIGAPGAPE